MPYLHWETTRQRQRFTDEMERIVAGQKEERQENEEQSKQLRQQRWKWLEGTKVPPCPKSSREAGYWPATLEAFREFFKGKRNGNAGEATSVEVNPVATRRIHNNGRSWSIPTAVFELLA